MNRTMIRGVTAGAIGASLLVGAAVAGPTIALGAIDFPAVTATAPSTTIDNPWELPRKELMHPAAVPHRHHRRPHHRRASRAATRTALTGSPRTVAHALVLRDGWDEAQWSCLDQLWTRESDWETYASNAGSGAYGIPQALPASKMASAGPDWRTNPVTQIRWGLSYIAGTYGSPCAALSHSSSYGFY